MEREQLLARIEVLNVASEKQVVAGARLEEEKVQPKGTQLQDMRASSSFQSRSRELVEDPFRSQEVEGDPFREQ